MRTLFLFRDSYDAQYILSKLDGKFISGVILEKGAKAKKSKLRKIFKKTSFLQYPATVFNVSALVIYSSVALSLMKKKLGTFVYPGEKIKLVIDDANDEKCIDYIKKFKPDVLCIYGTAILKKEFLDSVKCPIFNIHSGILPYYRNVHSDFWAYHNKDFNNIGVTIIYLDAGIDSGDIALQKKIQYEKGDSLIDIKVKNLSLIPTLVMHLIKDYKLKKLKRVKQNKKLKSFYLTPGFIDISKLLRNNYE